MNTKLMKLTDIIPAVYNPRKDLAPGDFEYERLKQSIETFGFVEPLVVNVRNNVLIGGHQRLKILIQNGETETEVISVDLDEQKEKALNLALNKIEGFWDYEKLESLFSEFDAEDLVVTGFTQAEISDMFDRAYGDSEPFTMATEKDKEKDAKHIEQLNEYNLNDEKPCLIYLSFATREAAEAWLTEREIDKTFTKTQNIIIKMEGTEYGTEND